jgi:hypothetical protein
VPEYDAFGRALDEDPLARLRAATVGPVPAPAAEAVGAPAPAPHRFVVRRARRRHRGVAALLVLLAVVAGLAWAANIVVVTVQDGIDGIIHSPATRAPTGLGRASLIRRANFAGALATLRKSGLGRPLTLRVAPDRVDATLVGEGGRTHQVQIDFEGSLRELGSNAGPARGTIPFGRIDPNAPQRLVRAGAVRAGVRARRIDHLVLTAGTPLAWGAYYKGGKVVTGDAHGRPQRRALRP